MTKLWVKLKPNNAAEVSTENCTNVYQFIKEVKKELSPDLDNIPPSRISLSLTDGGPALRPGLQLTDIPSQPGYLENDDENPLFITVTETAAQNTSLSHRSSVSSISCKSQSISGRCSTGRHTDRNKGIQSRFRRELVKRDTYCIATGNTQGLVAAHLVPLNKSELIARDMLFSPRNGVLLHENLEDDYDRHKWIFDCHGDVTVLFSNWISCVQKWIAPQVSKIGFKLQA
jgi:hypothetical protein